MSVYVGVSRDDLLRFVRTIAEMSQDGEERADGEAFEMENDDAVETLCSLIGEARELVAIRRTI